jgi:hypothetical protein
VTSDAPFDRITLVEGGRRRDVTVSEFLAMPLDTRIRAILQRAVEFYAGDQPIDRQRALNFLRSRKAH